jgi:hypothetical protein
MSNQQEIATLMIGSHPTKHGNQQEIANLPESVTSGQSSFSNLSSPTSFKEYKQLFIRFLLSATRPSGECVPALAVGAEHQKLSFNTYHLFNEMAIKSLTKKEVKPLFCRTPWPSLGRCVPLAMLHNKRWELSSCAVVARAAEP